MQDLVLPKLSLSSRGCKPWLTREMKRKTFIFLYTKFKTFWLLTFWERFIKWAPKDTGRNAYTLGLKKKKASKKLGSKRKKSGRRTPNM